MEATTTAANRGDVRQDMEARWDGGRGSRLDNDDAREGDGSADEAACDFGAMAAGYGGEVRRRTGQDTEAKCDDERRRGATRWATTDGGVSRRGGRRRTAEWSDAVGERRRL
nr:unnamed protein product [Digitaria exilis]